MDFLTTEDVMNPLQTPVSEVLCRRAPEGPLEGLLERSDAAPGKGEQMSITPVPGPGDPGGQPASGPPAGPPAGWYPDPQMVGTLRYWDGWQWTEARAPIPPSAPAPQQPTTVVVERSANRSGLDCSGLGCALLVLVVLTTISVIILL